MDNLVAEPIGPYRPFVSVKAENTLVYLSGQIPLDGSTKLIVEGGVETQTKQVIENIEAILRSINLTLDHVVKATCYLTDMSNFESFNKVYSSYFSNKPARSCVAVNELPKKSLIEIEVIASTEEDKQSEL